MVGNVIHGGVQLLRVDRRFTSRPFTVVACQGCTPHLTDMVMPRLREVVRGCPHGVLVVTRCLMGRLGCAARGPERGVVLLLQPCTTERVPVSAVHWAGPIHTEVEAETVCRWISAGRWDRSELPLNLQADQNLAKASRLN